jgi:hypothetical protein
MSADRFWQSSGVLARERELTGIDIGGLFPRADAVRAIPREVLMRTLALAILTIGTLWVAPSARAQTYSPDYPVCLQVYDIYYIECGYTSLAQCAQSASGRAAQCVINPYFASAQAPAARLYRGHRRVY